MSLAFHACPPPGTWLNDPNGLLRVPDGWRLFAQYRDDAPDFSVTHWAAFSSPDLVQWRFDRIAIPAAADGWAYSGNIVAAAGSIEAFHTLHDPATQAERQVRRASHDHGLSWSLPEPMLGDAEANRRDPFVWERDGGGWGLLVARPCGWDEPTAASRLERWSSPDRAAWTPQPPVGPFEAAGVMWEVPVMIEWGAGSATLLVSTIDRRQGRADCAVRAWSGRFERDAFAVDPGAGELLDLGPDFYAATLATDNDSAAAPRTLVAWLASWQTARAMPWPGFAGGPISLPREVARHPSGGFIQHPRVGEDVFGVPVDAVPVAGRGSATIASDFRLTLESEQASLDIRVERGRLTAERSGADWLAWRTDAPWRAGEDRLDLFVDGPAIELFFGSGRTPLSVALPGGGRPFDVRLADGSGPRAFAWRSLRPRSP